MNRGSVWWTQFGPAVGGEIRKTRPAIVISNNPANRTSNRVQVVPVTSKIGKVQPYHAVVTISGKQGKALANQITTVSKLRIGQKICEITSQEIADVEKALKVQLRL